MTITPAAPCDTCGRAGPPVGNLAVTIRGVELDVRAIVRPGDASVGAGPEIDVLDVLEVRVAGRTWRTGDDVAGILLALRLDTRDPYGELCEAVVAEWERAEDRGREWAA